MKKDYTSITVLLDRSGSMESIKKDMEGGFNDFIKEQAKLPGECKVSLYQFDTMFETVYEDVDVKDVAKLKLVPRGGTSLLDGQFKAVTLTGERLAKLEEKDRPDRVVFVTITDGGENSSSEVTNAQVAALVKQQTEQYNWQFLYLGANQDAFAVGGDMSIGAKSCLNYAANSAGVAASYRSLTRSVSDYRSGKVEACSFEESNEA